MDQILCDGHGKLCFLKTGTKDGPNKGKSYYICSMGPGKQCNYVQQARLPVSHCLVHDGGPVELQALGSNHSTGEQKRYFRCSRYRELSKGWCGSVVIGKTDQQVDASMRQPLKDRNGHHGMQDPHMSQAVKQAPQKPYQSDKVEGKDHSRRPPNQSKPPPSEQNPCATDMSEVRGEGGKGPGRHSDGTDKVLDEAVKEGRSSSQAQVPKDKILPASVSALQSEIDKLSDSFSSQMDISGHNDVFESASGASGEACKARPPARISSTKEASASHQKSSNQVANGSSEREASSGRVLTGQPVNHSIGHQKAKIQEPSNAVPSKASSQISSGREANAASSHSSGIVASTIQPKSSLSASSTLPTRPNIPPNLAKSRDAQPSQKVPQVIDLTSEEDQPSGGSSQPSNTQARNTTVPSMRPIVPTSQSSTNKQASLFQTFQRVSSQQQLTSQAVLKDIQLKHQLLRDLDKQKNVVKSVPLSMLPDKGARLIQRVASTEAELKAVEARLNKAKANGLFPSQALNGRLQQSSSAFGTTGQHQHQPYMSYQTSAQPQMTTLYGGRMTAVRQREVGSITKDAIEKLHASLQTCPAADTETDDPAGLKVKLMTHQRQAMTWLIWREQQHPCGGILADDMGLGKTLTMISLALLQKQLLKTQDTSDDPKKKDDSFITSQATLVVCPASLMQQWHKEVERRCAPGLLRVCLYHGANRERNAKKLSQYDLVLTTYNIISKELSFLSEKDKGDEPVQDQTSLSVQDQPLLLKICWGRIILDEAHNIKNHKCQTAMAVCRLRARARWAVTGTPIQNNLVDMYSLLRFLRCSPFDEYKVWKRQVDNSSKSGTNRLNVLVKSLLLRRTKDQKNSSTGKPLVALPDKQCHSHKIDLSNVERRVYDKLFGESKSKVQDYIRFHEDKEKGHGSTQVTSRTPSLFSSTGSAAVATTGGGMGVVPGGATGGAKTQDQRMHASHILVLLLRLRQCCGHLSLLKEAVHTDSCEPEGINLDLVGQMKEMNIADDETDASSESKDRESGTASKQSIFDKSRPSTKIASILSTLAKIRRDSPRGRPMKSVIISQWTGMLDVMGSHLTRAGYRFWSIRGDIPPKKRGEALEDFNNNPDGPEVMLVSLRAGGVGLNLIGGNHLFLLDMHWNPALEDQACDRVYRVGQTNNVSIHKFVCQNTIEERILHLQKSKSKLASDVLSGARSQSQKLSLADLRFLFGVN